MKVKLSSLLYQENEDFIKDSSTPLINEYEIKGHIEGQFGNYPATLLWLPFLVGTILLLLVPYGLILIHTFNSQLAEPLTAASIVIYLILFVVTGMVVFSVSALIVALLRFFPIYTSRKPIDKVYEKLMREGVITVGTLTYQSHDDDNTLIEYTYRNQRGRVIKGSYVAMSKNIQVTYDEVIVLYTDIFDALI